VQNYLPKPKFTYWIFDSTVGYLAEELMTEQNMQILQKKNPQAKWANLQQCQRTSRTNLT